MVYALGFIFFMIFVTGVCIGSFLNVVVLRAFTGESISYPGSKCPKCQKPLKWYHNIPLFSYLFLKGKCGFCKEKISIQYPIVEFVTGVLFVAVCAKFGFTLNSLFLLSISSLLVVIATTDILEKVVFDLHTYILVAIGLIYNFFNIGQFYQGVKVFNVLGYALQINHSFINALTGLIIGVLIMEVLARLGYVFAGTRAFGEGDSYIAAGLGAVFGIDKLLPILIYSLVIQVILTIPVFLKKLWKKEDYKTLWAFIGFFAFVAVFKLLDVANVVSNIFVFFAMISILVALGIYVCKRILGGLKEQNDLTYLPFGPAMVVAAVIILFTL